MKGNGHADQWWLLVSCEGWGWGFPVTRQGWLVFAAFFALLLIGIYLLPPRQSLGAFLLYVVVLSAVLVGVCWLKGEPPRWRWGND